MSEATTLHERRSFPKSVQPGIPRLRAAPDGWAIRPIGEVLRPVERRIALGDGESYQLVTAKRSRGGIVPRERLLGRDILTKTQFEVRAGDFLISRRQIAHGACGLVPRELDGAVVSNEYAALLPGVDLDLGFLRHLPHSIYFQQTCFHSSIGVHVEKLVFNLEAWLKWPFLLPPLPEQRLIAAVLDAWDEAIATMDRLIVAKRQRKDALLARLLFGSSQPSRRIGEIAAINPPAPAVPGDHMVSFVAMEDVSEQGRLIRTTDRRRSDLGSGYTGFAEGDVLVAKITPCFENGKGAIAENLSNGAGFGSTEFMSSARATRS